jgi:hypothetical protein
MGMGQLVDLDVDNMPLADVVSVLTSQWDVEEAYRVIDIVVHNSARDVRVTAKVRRWPISAVLRMLMEKAGLTSTSAYQEDEPYPRETFYLVPNPGLKVMGPGIVPQRTGDRVGPPMEFGKALDEQLIEKLNFVGYDLRHCPNCHALVLGQDWTFCAYCGAKLPEESGE